MMYMYILYSYSWRIFEIFPRLTCTRVRGLFGISLFMCTKGIWSSSHSRFLLHLIDFDVWWGCRLTRRPANGLSQSDSGACARTPSIRGFTISVVFLEFHCFIFLYSVYSSIWRGFKWSTVNKKTKKRW